MNKVILMGRLTRDPEMRYGQSGTGIASFSLAVDRRFKREGQAEADFFNCTAFGKQGEFVEKYLRKGTKVLLEGEIQQNNYTNKDGQEVRSYQVITNSIEFAESKNASQAAGGDYSQGPSTDAGSDFLNIPDNVDEQLPF